MNPKKTSAFIFLVLLTLLALTLLSESLEKKAGIQEEGFSLGFTTLKYPKFSSFLNDGKVLDNKKQIDSIVQNIQPVLSEEVSDLTNEIATPPDFSIIDTTKIVRIAFPENKHQFVSKLLSQLTDETCRIIHYGDSQLEGDRVSAYLRNRLQGMYGGSGPGFIPIKQVYQQISAEVIPSEQWLRYAAFDPTQEKMEHRKYGLYTSISRFHPYITPSDSLSTQPLNWQKATININPSKRLYSKLASYTRIGLHYGECIAPTSIKVYQDGNLIQSDSLLKDGQYHEYQLEFPSTPQNLLIELESTMSPDFYGITLDGSNGISLDNVAMRGASGTIFVSQDRTSFKQMVDNLQPKVFIFQYGGNTVPYLKDEKAVENYAKYVLSNINWVRRNNPEATVIFIGPSDMSTSVNGNRITYPLLPYLNKKLKETCVANNIAFWSLFDAMGGENSMPYWVDQELASNDYTHFTVNGYRIISELFFTALQLDLKN
jgi:lysophospholipase L1-like esterase